MRRLPSATRSILVLLGSLLIVLIAVSCGDPEQPSSTTIPPPANDTMIVHYYRPLADYDGWQIVPTSGATSPVTIAPDGSDAFGAFFKIPVMAGSTVVRFRVEKDGVGEPEGEITVSRAALGDEVWVYAGTARAFGSAPAIPEAGSAIIYYRRLGGDYDGWGLNVWQDAADIDITAWDKPLPQAGVDAFGAYFIVHLKDDAKQVGFLIHQGNTKDPGPDQFLLPAEHGRRIWIVSGDTTIYTYPADPPLIDAARAHWVTKDTIAWSPPGDDGILEGSTLTLHASPSGDIKGKNGRLEGGNAIALTYDKGGLSGEILAKRPHLANYRALRIGAADLEKVEEALKGQLVVSMAKADGTVLAATGVQIAGALDDLYSYNGELGVTFANGAPTLRLWAPTARSVKLHLFEAAKAPEASEVIEMAQSAGVWTASGPAAWDRNFYLYEVEVYVHSTGKVERNLVTDPYSLSLSANSERSQILDLSSPDLAPSGWGSLVKPAIDPADIALYELHVRDFSAGDPTVPAAHRGTFMAFTDQGSNGMTHLAKLAAAGLTHVHLLPIFDFATVNELKTEQKSPPDLSAFAPDSEEQQAAISMIKDEDAYNWGYDPFHFTAPEGSYATDPDGPARILELRSMVKGLYGAGLRVVMDVVYNHTTASGQAPKSVLDRVVPGYYHRLDLKGAVETSTCCQNTATEHAMMEKLMVDSLLTWARAYKIDGFRFDLMGHHMKSNMLKVKGALAALDPAKDGVVGPGIYLYGEGWDFGEVAGGARGENATQKAMAGTGIGTFNDRLRDAARGGGPFDSGDDLKKQGYVSGLFTAPNDLAQGTPDEQKATLLRLKDQIRVGLAGNLKDYSFEGAGGEPVTGAEIDYNGQPAGYTQDPVEAITYVEAHDNQTFFDILQYKAPEGTDMAARVAMQKLGLSLVALGQGVPFFHAGMELMRSKSLDRDSYNSGDWFNRIDFSYASNNWGAGLPPKDANESNWSLMKPLLADLTRKPAKEDIEQVALHLQTMLSIRKSSKLFRLGAGDAVKARVRFHNTGPAQEAGLILMSISDEEPGLPDLDPALGVVVIALNAAPSEVTYSDADFNASALTLHPTQLALAGDPVQGATFAAGTFTIPARAAAVFVGTANFP
jgi:pullulanase-type alpha-1,6-glucosidase